MTTTPARPCWTRETARDLSRNRLDFVDRGVFHFDADAVTGLSLQKTDGSLTVDLAKQDDGWKLVKPAADAADDQSVQELVGRLAALRAVRVADYPAGKLDAFGLAKPEATATITLKPDAKTPKAILLIGKAVDAPDGDRFAMAEGGRAVVVIPARRGARRLTSGALAFRDRSLLKVASDPDRVRLDRDPRKAVFSKVEGSWKMTEPVKCRPRPGRPLDDFLNSLLDAAGRRTGVREADSGRSEGVRTRPSGGEMALAERRQGSADRSRSARPRRTAVGPTPGWRGRDLVFLLDPGLDGQGRLGEFRTRTVWTTPLDAVQIVGLEYRRAGGGFELVKGDDGWQAGEARASRTRRLSLPHGRGDAGGAGRVEAGAATSRTRMRTWRCSAWRRSRR